MGSVQGCYWTPREKDLVGVPTGSSRSGVVHITLIIYLVALPTIVDS